MPAAVAGRKVASMERTARSRASLEEGEAVERLCFANSSSRPEIGWIFLIIFFLLVNVPPLPPLLPGRILLPPSLSPLSPPVSSGPGGFGHRRDVSSPGLGFPRR